jgi:hypothetical protein
MAGAPIEDGGPGFFLRRSIALDSVRPRSDTSASPHSRLPMLDARRLFRDRNGFFISVESSGKLDQK